MHIATERCLIRPFTEQDLDDFMAYRNDMDWMLYQGFKGLTKEAYRAALFKDAASSPGRQLAIIARETNRLIGDLYLKADAGCHWIGYTISPAYARQGYAFEAVSALIEALQREGSACIKAGVDPGNAASIALLLKLGFVFDSDDEGERVYVCRSNSSEAILIG